MSKRASYKEGISWIALNDEPLDQDLDSIAGYISTSLLADLFHKDRDSVAKDILNKRMKQKADLYER